MNFNLFMVINKKIWLTQRLVLEESKEKTTL